MSGGDLRQLARLLDQTDTIEIRGDRATLFDAAGRVLASDVTKWEMYVALTHGGDEQFAIMVIEGGLEP